MTPTQCLHVVGLLLICLTREAMQFMANSTQFSTNDKWKKIKWKNPEFARDTFELILRLSGISTFSRNSNSIDRLVRRKQFNWPITTNENFTIENRKSRSDRKKMRKVQRHKQSLARPLARTIFVVVKCHRHYRPFCGPLLLLEIFRYYAHKTSGDRSIRENKRKSHTQTHCWLTALSDAL